MAAIGEDSGQGVNLSFTFVHFLAAGYMFISEGSFTILESFLLH